MDSIEDQRDDIVDVRGVWMIGAVDLQGWQIKKQVHLRRFRACSSRPGPWTEVDQGQRNGLNVADIKRPLASAMEVVPAGNRAVMNPEGS